MTSNGVGRVDFLFDGIFSYSGYLTAGSYNFFINALATTASAQTVLSGYSYDLQLTVVSVPAAVWLFGSGLIGLIGLFRRETF